MLAEDLKVRDAALTRLGRRDAELARELATIDFDAPAPGNVSGSGAGGVAEENKSYLPRSSDVGVPSNTNRSDLGMVSPISKSYRNYHQTGNIKAGKAVSRGSEINHSPSRTRRAVKTGLAPVQGHGAKWDDYDVMRCRWRYLGPHTRRLLPENSIEVPTSPSARYLVRETDVPVYLTGDIQDVERYRKVAVEPAWKAMGLPPSP
jgi:hypothetical protein